MLTQLFDRLTARLTDPRWSGVEIAEDIGALTDRAGEVEGGTAILMPFRERAADPVTFTGGFRQLVDEHYAIGVVLRLHDDWLGGERARAFAAYKADLEAALAGWVPPDSPADCVLIGAETSPVDKGVSIYVQTWSVRRFLTGVQS